MKNVIMAAVDLQHDQQDQHIVEEALALAQYHKGELHLVFVIPDEKNSYVQSYIPKDMQAQVNADAKADLDKFAGSIDSGDTVLKTHVLRGIAYEEIVNFSNTINADIIAVGAHKPGIRDFFQGPNSARVARHADCSVMIVRPPRAR